jgi:rubrerythrin
MDETNYGVWVCANCRVISSPSEDQCPKCYSVVKYFAKMEKL